MGMLEVEQLQPRHLDRVWMDKDGDIWRPSTTSLEHAEWLCEHHQPGAVHAVAVAVPGPEYGPYTLLRYVADEP